MSQVWKQLRYEPKLMYIEYGKNVHQYFVSVLPKNQVESTNQHFTLV